MDVHADPSFGSDAVSLRSTTGELVHSDQNSMGHDAIQNSNYETSFYGYQLAEHPDLPLRDWTF